jgi:hypothetical protein
MALLLILGSGAAISADLYVARTLVTGQGEAGRQAGFATTLRQVLVKVSGDPTLASDPRVAAIAAEPAAFVAGFDYHDRMTGIPVHDEQGTRDRPYDLTVSFDHSKVDAALGALGHAPWPEPRPPLAVFVDVETGAVTYPLAGDGNAGRDLREALADAAWRFGMTAELPTAAVWASLREGAVPSPQASSAWIEAAALAMGGDRVLAGSLAWSDADLGWTAVWQMKSADQVVRWSIVGVSFDVAFRQGVGGAAQLLSGNGRPN